MPDNIRINNLALKPYSDGDQAAMIELLTNEKIKETFMIPDFNTEDEAICMFKKLQTFSHSEDHYERGLYIEQQLIGFLNDVEIMDKKIELGYVIHPLYQNKGYATQALREAIKDLFQKGYNEIITCAFANNAASFRVMEKCGMTRIEKQEYIHYHNVARLCYYYAIRKADQL